MDGDFYREPDGSTLLLKQHELPLLEVRGNPTEVPRIRTNGIVWALRIGSSFKEQANQAQRNREKEIGGWYRSALINFVASRK